MNGQNNNIVIDLEHIYLPERGQLVRAVNGGIWYEDGEYTLLPVSYAYIHNPNSIMFVACAIGNLVKPIEVMYNRAMYDSYGE